MNKQMTPTLNMLVGLLLTTAPLITTATEAVMVESIRCGKLLDVRKGVWRENVVVQIANGQFQKIEPYFQQTVSVDLGQAYCLPGFIDSHVHLSSETIPQVEALRRNASFGPADIAYTSIKNAEITLMAGFTTVRDLGGADGVNIAMKRAIERGDIIGPRVFTAGRMIATTGGHGDGSNIQSDIQRHKNPPPTPLTGVINSPDEARQAVRARYQEGADLIKITATGGVLSQAKNGLNAQFTPDELSAIVSTAHDYGFTVAAHAHGLEGIKRALKAGVDSIEHGTFIDDEAIGLFKKFNAWYVPTISAGRFVADMAKVPNYYSPLVQPKAASIGPLIQATFAKAYKAGVKIAFGTDASVFPHGQNAKEFIYMVDAGMPPIEAIRSATVNAASLLNQSEALGQVEPNFAADLIAVKQDPLKQIDALLKVTFVMKAGKLHKNLMD